MSDPASSLLLLLAKAHRYLDGRNHPPAPPRHPWADWRRTVAGRP